jgi:hypothetical protein
MKAAHDYNFPEVTFTELTDYNSVLTKQYSIFFDCFKKNSPGIMSSGTASQKEMPLNELITYFKKLDTNQAICHGITNKKIVEITTSGKEDKNKISRTKNFFEYPKCKPSLILLDIDADDSPGSTSILSPKQLMDIIENILPEIANAAYIAKPSASSGIYNADTKELLTSNCGFHIYIVAEDGSDIPRFINVLFKRLVLAGYGHIKISRSGSQLIRTVIDGAIKSPERIDYVAPAIIGKGLYRSIIKPTMRPGSMLDTTTMVDLTKQEGLLYSRLIKKLKEKTKVAADIVRNKYAEQKSLELGIPKNKVMEALESAYKGILTHEFILTLNDGTTVTVEEIYSNPNKWNGVSLRDPLDPDKGSSKAMIMVKDLGEIIIHSFAHGGSIYTLNNKPVDLHSGIAYKDISDTEKLLKEFNVKVINCLDDMDEVSII